MSKISFNNIDIQLISKFTKYLREICEHSPSTRGKQVKNIKAVMNNASKKGLHSNTSYQKATKENEASINIYLNETELKLLKNLKGLSLLEQKLVDILCFLSYSGMRYSDYHKLQSFHFSKKETDIKGIKKQVVWLNFIQTKTSNEVGIPLIYKEAIEILDKYDYNLPKLANVYFNKNIKIFLKKKKLFEDKIPISKERIKGHVIKREVISSHIGRRSFCTNLYIKGIPIQYIMAASGHKEETAFKLYIKANQKDQAKGLAQWLEY